MIHVEALFVDKTDASWHYVLSYFMVERSSTVGHIAALSSEDGALVDDNTL